MTGISLFLSIRAMVLSHGERSELNFIVYAILLLGIIVAVAGLLQLFKRNSVYGNSRE